MEQLIKPAPRYHGATIATLEYCYLESPTSTHVTVNIRFYTVDASASRTAQGAARVELPLYLAGEYLAKSESGTDYVTENAIMFQNALQQIDIETETI